MKKNLVGITILIVAYLVICGGVWFLLSENKSQAYSNNVFNTSKRNEVNIIKTFYRADIGEIENIITGVILESNNIRSDIDMINGSKPIKDFKVVLTDNESYQNDLKDNGIIDTAKLNIIENYESSIDIFKDKRYEKAVKNIVKDSSKINEKTDDLLIVVSSGERVLESFYIDGRIVDYKDSLHKVITQNDYSYYSFGYNNHLGQLILTQNNNNTNPKWKIILDEATFEEHTVYYDSENQVAVHNIEKFSKATGDHIGGTGWEENMTKEEFEKYFGDIKSQYKYLDNGSIVKERENPLNN